MTHIEGPIVDSFYDICLNSWHREMHPPLPLLSEPAVSRGFPTFEEKPPGLVPEIPTTDAGLPEHTSKDPHYDHDIASEILRSQSVLAPKGSETRMHAVTRHLS